MSNFQRAVAAIGAPADPAHVSGLLDQERTDIPPLKLAAALDHRHLDAQVVEAVTAEPDLAAA